MQALSWAACGRPFELCDAGQRQLSVVGHQNLVILADIYVVKLAADK